jgi:hypothetical protein
VQTDVIHHTVKPPFATFRRGRYSMTPLNLADPAILPRAADQRAPTSTRSSSEWIPSPSEIAELTRESKCMSQALGLALGVVDADTGRLLTQTDEEWLPLTPRDLILRAASTREPSVDSPSSDIVCFAMAMARRGSARPVAVGYALTRPGVRPLQLSVAASARKWTSQEFTAWIAEQPTCSHDVIRKLLEYCTPASGPVLSRPVSAASPLVSLASRMNVRRPATELAQLALEQLNELIPCNSQVILLSPRGENSVFVGRGLLPFDEPSFRRFVARVDETGLTEPLIRNLKPDDRLRREYPLVHGFALAPLLAEGELLGWICCFECVGERRPFTEADADVLSCVATILAVHTRNVGLFSEQDELMLSFVRSMVSTLDAKDPYTRGHSERVALIARRIAEELGWTGARLQDLYVSGLLHDIGKVGVDDRILRKPDALTAEEFAIVKKHPVIGENILAGLASLKAVLPGVRSHHENWSGGGYPDNLSGNAIPEMARIIAVADSYDAIISDRPYRSGLPLPTLERMFRDDQGKQWEPRIVDAYFSCRDSVRRICSEYPGSEGQLLLNHHCISP